MTVKELEKITFLKIFLVFLFFVLEKCIIFVLDFDKQKSKLFGGKLKAEFSKTDNFWKLKTEKVSQNYL